MDALAAALRYEMLLLLLILIAIIAYKMLVQEINTSGLLLDKTDRRVISAGRLQLLIVTLSIAIYYLFLVMETKDSGKLPDMPNEFIVALAGSHSIFLAGKLYDMLLSKLGLASTRLLKIVNPQDGG
jgi:hypothetical protein